jgi:type VI secretion system secreted protein Hcp
MSVNAYLYIDGIEGPSTSKMFHIDILRFGFAVSQAAVYGAGASGKEAKAGRADFQDLSVTKVLDSTSTLLCDRCATGKILKEVYILYAKPIGERSPESHFYQEGYFRIWLKDALITSVQLQGEGMGPTETVKFAFQGVEVAYKPEMDNGTLDASISKGFDLATLRPDFAAPVQF